MVSMFATRHQWFAVSLLSLALASCDPTQPIAPRIQDVSASSPQSTVTAPSSLTAAAASQTRIDLTWQDNSTNETGFEIRRSTTGPDGSFPPVATTAANATSYADTGLTPATQYCYKVRAVSVTRKATTYSPSTAPACATTPAPPPPPVPPGPPQAPQSATASAAGLRAVMVSWSDKSNNEDGFRLERSADGGATWATVATSAANISSVADYDVASETQFCYRVSAFNGEGVSPPSNTSCATTVAGPTDLAITRQGLLTWTDNSAIEDGYEMRMIMGAWWYGNEVVDTLPANTTSFQTEGCGGWCLGFSVVAVKDGGYSDVAKIILPLAVPSNLTATAVSTGEVDLSWVDAPSLGELSAQWFSIERCAGDASACGDADFVEIASIDASTTFRDTRVLSGLTYSYRVRAHTNAEASGPSNSATVIVP
jgi:fibronectin type III domain protein